MKSSRVSKFFSLLLASAFLGGVLSTLIAPRLITWYAEPAVDMGFNCASTAAWATRTLLKWQLTGCAVGIVIALVLLGFLAYRNRQKNAAL